MKLTRKVHVALESLLLVAQRQGSSPLSRNIISSEPFGYTAHRSTPRLIATPTLA